MPVIEEMVFEEDLSPIEVPIRIGDKVKYILREASADAGIKYRNAVSRGTVIHTDTKTIESGGENANADAVAVAACLFEVLGEGKVRPVILSQVLAFKDSMLSKLFDKLKEISPNLVQSDKDKAKNEPSAGTDSSD